MENRDYGEPGVAPEAPHPLKDQATRLSGAARGRVLSTADEKKGILVEQVAGFARSLEGQGGVGDKLAGWLREVQNALETRSTEELLQVAERKVKEHPAAFLAGCVALGFLGARLVRG